MSKFRFNLTVKLVIIAIFVMVMSAIAYFFAQSKVDYGAKLGFFKSIPAEELMSKSEFKYYTRALENMDCELASILLNTSFTRHYAQFKWARLEPECPWDAKCSQWDIYSWSIFDEYGYCKTVLGFNQADEEIRLHKLTAPKFNVSRAEYESYYFEKRDNNIGILIDLAERGYIPALLKIAELLRRGDVFVRSAETEYYVYRRICFLGYEGCTNLQPRLAELEETLTPKRIALLEQKVSGHLYGMSVLIDLLVEGTLPTSESY